MGYIRTQLKEHTIIESHPDNQHPDLRLDKPFPAFIQFANSIKLEEMDLKDHAHVPYVIVLYKYLQVRCVACLKASFLFHISIELSIVEMEK